MVIILINSGNLFSGRGIDILTRKLMLVTHGT